MRVLSLALQVCKRLREEYAEAVLDFMHISSSLVETNERTNAAIVRTSIVMEESTHSETLSTISFPPPPAYTTVTGVNHEQQFGTESPPNYFDVEYATMIELNSYPDLTDGNGHSQVNQSDTAHDEKGVLLPNAFRVYLLLSSVLTLVFGCTCIALQTLALVNHTATYFFYGFWTGGLLLAFGINDLIMFARSRPLKYSSLVRSFLVTITLMAIVVPSGVVIVVILTNPCNNDSATGGHARAAPCERTQKLLSGLLLGISVAALLQALVNGCLFRIFRRRRRAA
jgi:hypothetical protein